MLTDPVNCITEIIRTHKCFYYVPKLVYIFLVYFVNNVMNLNVFGICKFENTLCLSFLFIFSVHVAISLKTLLIQMRKTSSGITARFHENLRNSHRIFLISSSVFLGGRYKEYYDGVNK